MRHSYGTRCGELRPTVRECISRRPLYPIVSAALLCVTGSDNDKAKKREMFLDASLGLCVSSDVAVMTSATASLFKQLGASVVDYIFSVLRIALISMTLS